MTYTGTIKGNKIEFDRMLPFTDAPPRNSPQAWLTFFAGTLSDDEAELILHGAEECRTIDAKMWETPKFGEEEQKHNIS